MIRFILNQVTRFLYKRTIRAPDGEPYLSRFYIWGKPYMKDGSFAFDDRGEPKRDVVWPNGIGVYLHRFHSSDPNDGWLHNHPFSWALSFILAGGYSEERRYYHEVIRREFHPISINFITPQDYHRVDLYEEDAWSLFAAHDRRHRKRSPRILGGGYPDGPRRLHHGPLLRLTGMQSL